jgi:hypothetical protein
LVVEVAQAKSQQGTTGGLTAQQLGNAQRVEFSTSTQAKVGNVPAVQLTAYAAKADKDFYNPAASVNEGRQENKINLQAQFTPQLKLVTELLQSKDNNANLTVPASRKGAYLGGELQVGSAVTLMAGVRHVQDNGSGLYSASLSGLGTQSLYGAAGIFGDNSTTAGQTAQVGTQTGDPLNTTTLNVGAKYQVGTHVTLGIEGEVGKNKDSLLGNTDVNRLSTYTKYQITPSTALSARYETQTGLGSYYDRAQRNNQFVLGVNTAVKTDDTDTGALFSEYRLRDAMSGRESLLSSGFRNTYGIGDGLKATTGIEYIKFLDAAPSGPTLSLAGGLDYTGSDLWKGSTRLELRRTGGVAGSTGLLHTVSIARKLDREWTLLARNYLAQSDAKATVGQQFQDRIQIGFAYRPVDTNRLNLLGKAEYKTESNTESLNESRKVSVLSLSANWHAQRSVWLTGRVAGKYAVERIGGAGPDRFVAGMYSGRVIWDINHRWDLGVMGSLLAGQGTKQYAYGLELGTLAAKNIWISAGYNFMGFTDRDLTENVYTAKGLYVRLRAKFEEDLFTR